MTDFTKYELMELKYWLEHADDSVDPINHYNLMSKLQSMIDNYPKCDHRIGLNHYNEKGDIVGYDSDIYRCRYCDILFRYLFENGVCIGHEVLE